MSSELDLLELELEELVLRSFWTVIFSFLRRSFLLPHLRFLSFGMAACNLADFSLSHQGQVDTETDDNMCSSMHQAHALNCSKSDMVQGDPCADRDRRHHVLFSATGP